MSRLIAPLFAKFFAQIISHATKDVKDFLFFILYYQSNDMQNKFNRRIECSKSKVEHEVILANMGDTVPYMGSHPVAGNTPNMPKERNTYDIFQKKNR